ncbi:hypothetical protein ASC95_14290 [Pelomonas sp. Root1217]|uniref:hypothetical protein n=1 Tax=Pelomonas sp. Root1217 TaxID=1736430 RepID=UPI00070FE48B|nr:hypothetical protein [Pelomonas sp. Root1217]KQV50531.1 hypothetical protein ASC95_14290 [Pelomonas sp. Root1217]
MNRFLNVLYSLALAAGLAGIAGAALAAARHHPVALAMTLLIAAFFAIGIWELTAFRRSSRELDAALDAEPKEGWVATLPAALRASVQQRLEGLRVALPGLALAPALAGLLVLLGMLGTFIGLVITLSSTASALGQTADLAALRTALSAPVQGLGLAFSASVAGVTGSAMLGLMVALARRERAAVSGQLDTALLGKLRPLTAAHRRALEQQATEAAAAEAAQQRQLELVAQLQLHAKQMADLLAAQNDRFHGETHQAYAALAASVDTTLRSSLAESARLAGAAIQPAAEAAMAGIAREAAALHERVGTQVAGQLGALSSRFEAGVAQIAQQGEAAADAQAEGLAQQREAALKLLADTGAATQQAVDRLGERWAAQAQDLLAAQAQADTARAAALGRQIDALAEQRAATQQAIADTAERFAAQTQTLLDRVAEAQARQQVLQAELDTQRRAESQADAEALAQQRAANEQLLAAQREAAQQLLADSGERAQNALTALTTGFSAQTRDLLDRIADTQTRHAALQAELDSQRRAEARADAEALARQRTANEQLLIAQREAAQQLLAASGERAQSALTELTAGFAAQTQAAVTTLAEAHTQLQSAHAAHDAERLAAWRTELQSAGATQLAQQQQLADGLLRHTRELVAQTEAQAKTTLSEAGALLQAAGEAPRAAVEVVAALREQLAQSQAQDRAALAERAELMQTVSTLLASLQQAAGEQRAAIDALVASSATQLEALGQHFTAQADATGEKLAEAATTLAASAAEMGSLGEGFGAAVEQFQGANAQLVQHLAALEERLAGAMTRSDEQLSYYVAQAREVIDLCLGSQKQVLDALQGAAANG